MESVVVSTFLLMTNPTFFDADVTGAIDVTTVDFSGTSIHGLVLDDGTVIDSDPDW